MPRTLVDYGRFEIDVGVRCRRCERLAVFAPEDVMRHFVAMGWSMAIPLTTEPFHCRRCRSRDIETIAVPIACRPDPLPAPASRLVPLYVQDRK